MPGTVLGSKESMKGKRCHFYPHGEADINQINSITIMLMCYGEDVSGLIKESNKTD